MKKKPKTSLIQLEIDGPIANVRLARPDKYNAMNVQMITELIEVFAWTAEHSVGSKGVLFSEDETPYLRALVASMFHNRLDTRGRIGWWRWPSCMFRSCCLQTRSKDCTI